MIKNIILSLIILVGFKSKAQVGINTTSPKAQLEIKSSNEAMPANTDGLLIPKINAFPTINPTADQQGMLVYLTTTVGTNAPGFYFWDNPSNSWKPIGNDQDKDFLKVGTSEASTNILDNKFTLGNNGFGTTNPLFPLHVEGRVALGRASASTGQLTFFPNNGDAWFHLENKNNGRFSLSHGATPGFEDLMTWQFNGNTGIGTTSPARRLHVSNGISGATSSGNTGILLESNGTVFQHFLTPSTAENGLLFGTEANSIGSALIFNNTSALNGLQFRTGGNFTRMTLSNTGNLGIGTQTPTRRLHVSNGASGATSNANTGVVVESNGTVFQHFLTPSTAENGLLFGTEANSIGSALIYNNASTLNGLQFRTGGNFTRMTLTEGGNLGLGTVNPLDRLHVVGNIRMVDGNQAAGKVLTSDANGTATWTTAGSIASGTLDQSYDFGGAGNGRTITADTGAVTIAGTDGLVSTGTLFSGAVSPSGAGVKMFWNPRKAAFRAGEVFTNEWDDANIGIKSVAMGHATIASGNFSTAFGNDAEAIGGVSTAFGINTNANGNVSTVFGRINIANGDHSFVTGRNNFGNSYGETVIGIGATNYTTSTNGATEFRTANATDRLFVIGNAIDANNNGSVDAAERSDAMVVLKNGKTGFGTSFPLSNVEIVGNNVTTGPFTYGNLHIRTSDTFAADVGASLSLGGMFGTSSTRNFGTIEARKSNNNIFEQNAYLIFKTLGFGDLSERMRITSNGDVGIGTSTPLSKLHVVGNLTMVDGNQAAGKVLTSDANGTATWQNASVNAWGLTGNSGTSSTNFIGTTDATTLSMRTNNTDRMKLLSNGNIEIGGAPIPSLFEAGTSKLLVGSESSTTDNLTVWAAHSTTAGRATLNLARQRGSFSSTLPVSNGDGLGELVFSGYSNALGSHLTAASVFADVDGTLAANNVPAKLGFSTAPETGGSPIERMTIRANGNVGIGTSTPTQRLHVVGKSLFENGFTSDNAALLYNNDTNYMYIGPNSGSSSNGGAIALYGSTSGTFGNAGGIDLNAPNNSIRLFHTNGNFSFRANSTSGYAATFEINDTGLEIRHNSASRAFVFSPNSTERMRLTPGGFLGIGTTAPARKLHVSNGVSGGTSNASTGILLESSGNVYQHYLAPSASESGMLFGSEVASINGGIIFNNSLATSGIQFRAGGNTNRMTITSSGDVGIGTTAPGGQFELSLNEGRKPTSNTWTIPSDARLKNVDGIYQKGLSEILQLKPIRYHYKNTDKKSFESDVLAKEAYGFLAQEVQQIFPEAVGTDADGYLNFDLHPILVAYANAFKELNVKSKAVEDKNRELELQLQSQEQIINNLMERLERLEAKN